MKRLLLGIAFLIGATLGSAAQSSSDRELVTFDLDNGLRVALAPDDTVPKVAMFLRYRVGSMNEPAGRSGFAHLFEHLMFSGTTAWPSVFGAHLAHGNTINAWTSEDGTVYYVEGISANLPMILSLEADRMANLGGEVDQSELDLQRSVVKNEMRQTSLDQAAGSGWQAIWGGLFPREHPYSRAVIGSMADLDAATLDDVRGFFNTYYVPNNAVLAIVGDFDLAEAKALVEQTFGVVPRGPDVATPVAPKSPPTAVRFDLEDRLPNPFVILGYTGPRETERPSAALAIAAEIMGNAEYGFLKHRLVDEKGLTTAVQAEWEPGLLGGRFAVYASAAPGVDAKTLEEAMKSAVADFVASTISSEDIERARQQLLLRHRLRIEPYGNRADAISYAADVMGDARLALRDDADLVSTTPEEIAAAIRETLQPSAVSVASIKPGERGNYPAVLVESTGVPQPFTAPARDGAPVPVLAATEAKPAEPPVAQQATLSNGASLIHYQMPSSPLAYVAAAATGGWDNAAPGKEGIFEMAATMAYRGAGDRDFATFAKAAKDLGADVSYRAEPMATAVTLSTLPENFGEATRLFADAVLRPRFDETEWSRAVAEQVDTIAWSLTDIATVNWNAALDRILPATGEQPSVNASIEAVESMTLDEVKALATRLYQPGSTTFVSVGPLSLDEVSAGIEAAFAGWTDSQPGFEPVRRRCATFEAGRNVVLVPEPGAAQSAIDLLRPAPGIDEPGRAAALAVVRLLGGDFSSRLNSVIREEKGYSYGVGGGLVGVIGKDSALYVGGTVDRENTGPALTEFFKGFDSLTVEPPSEDELRRTVTTYQSSLAGIAETGSGLFSVVLATRGVGDDLDAYYERQRAVVDLDLKAVQDMAPGLAPLNPGLVMITGDPDAILPQLEAIGVKAQVLEPRPTQASRSADALLGSASDVVPAGAPGRTKPSCPRGPDCEPDR